MLSSHSWSTKSVPFLPIITPIPRPIPPLVLFPPLLGTHLKSTQKPEAKKGKVSKPVLFPPLVRVPFSTRGGIGLGIGVILRNQKILIFDPHSPLMSTIVNIGQTPTPPNVNKICQQLIPKIFWRLRRAIPKSSSGTVFFVVSPTGEKILLFCSVKIQFS